MEAAHGGGTAPVSSGQDGGEHEAPLPRYMHWGFRHHRVGEDTSPLTPNLTGQGPVLWTAFSILHHQNLSSAYLQRSEVRGRALERKPAHQPRGSIMGELNDQGRPNPLSEPVFLLGPWGLACLPDLPLLCQGHTHAEGQAVASYRGTPGCRWPPDHSWFCVHWGPCLHLQDGTQTRGAPGSLAGSAHSRWTRSSGCCPAPRRGSSP